MPVDGIWFHARDKYGLIQALGAKLSVSVDRSLVEPLYAAPVPARAPDGWVMVPKEPSIAACINGSDVVGGAVDGYQCAAIYKAMLASTTQVK